MSCVTYIIMEAYAFIMKVPHEKRECETCVRGSADASGTQGFEHFPLSSSLLSVIVSCSRRMHRTLLACALISIFSCDSHTKVFVTECM